MAIIFDGRAYARELEDKLYHKIAKLPKRPTMATILVGEDPASHLYVRLKREAAERVGAEMDVYEFPASVPKDKLIDKINLLSQDKTINGIMVQLPLPLKIGSKAGSSNWKVEILEAIALSKDVDGLREASPFLPATTRAVLSILNEAQKHIKISPDAYTVVVGAKGEVGGSIVAELAKLGYEVGSVTKDMAEHDFIKETKEAHVLISATGSPGIITKDHVKKGAVVIDIGSPKGDVDFEVKSVAGFITPVPGGVGPVTVISLLENLAEAAYNTHITHTRG